MYVHTENVYDVEVLTPHNRTEEKEEGGRWSEARSGPPDASEGKPARSPITTRTAHTKVWLTFLHAFGSVQRLGAVRGPAGWHPEPRKAAVD